MREGRRKFTSRLLSVLMLVVMTLQGVALAGPATPALASHTPTPSSVTIAGDLQSEAGT